ncbi:MAG: ABC transporter permease, partial [Rhodothermales bacterium]|nr:ABC transporter permease [Rhodothermales bacterium]
MNFNLEQALAAWRRDLLRRPGLEPGVVQELESHLLDRFDELTAGGMDRESAFRTAVRSSIGEPEALADEYLTASDPFSTDRASWVRLIRTLFPNYVRTALRKFARRRGYAMMNVVGLAVALTSAFLILAFVVDELRFDRFHPDADRLFRIDVELSGPEGTTPLSRTPGPLAPLLDQVEPAVHSTVRFIDLGSQTIRDGDTGYSLNGVMYVDSSFFEIFGFRIVSGNSADPLRAPDAAVITRSTALKMFNTEDAVGRIVTLGMGGQDLD